LQLALGAAAYRGQEGEVEALRARLRELERRGEGCRARLRTSREQVRRSIERERLAERRTRAATPGRDVRDVEPPTSQR
jgi:hypothetical protein